eukprot:5972892-Amphidinium_carterae.1
MIKKCIKNPRIGNSFIFRASLSLEISIDQLMLARHRGLLGARLSPFTPTWKPDHLYLRQQFALTVRTEMITM